MDPRVLAATSQWRRHEQLRGLQPNHATTVATEVAPLANEGTLFDSCTMALHPNEQSLAVGMAPFMQAGPSAVGIVSLSSSSATCTANGFTLAPPRLGSTSPMFSVLRGNAGGEVVRNGSFVEGVKWLNMPANTPLTSLAWVGGAHNLLLMGSSQGRLLVAEQKGLAADVSAMPDQGPLKTLGELYVDVNKTPVAQCAVQPTNYAATTTVRCIRRCPMANGSSLIAAASGGGVHVWDLGGDAAPTLSIPINPDEPETAVCCAWGLSSHVVAVGGVGGTSLLADRRLGGAAAMYLPSPSEYAVRSIDVSRVMPSAILVASSKGVLTVVDARKPSAPVLTIDALQEMPVCAKWMPHHPDLFTSAGMDGTVKVWSLRSRPNYVVGCAQFSSAVSHLVIPHTYAATRVLGMTSDGQLCTTTLTRSAMMAVAPNGLRKDDAYIAAQRGVPVATPAEDAKDEQRAEGLLYCRAFRPLMKAVLSAAKRREQRGDLDFALRVCSLIDVKPVNGMDLGQLCEQAAAANGAMAALGALGIGVGGGAGMDGMLLGNNASPSEDPNGPSTLLQDMHTYSQRLPSTVVMADLKGFERPDPEDIVRINALKLNITMRKLLNANEVSYVVNGTATMMAIMGSRPELVETDVLVATTRFLLQCSRRDGTAFVTNAANVLFGLIDEAEGEDDIIKDNRDDFVPQRASHLLRALLLTASEPLITANTNVAPKKIRKIHRGFLGNLRVAKASVEAQMKVVDLDIKGGGGAFTSGGGSIVPSSSAATPQAIANAKAIVALVAKYQAAALADDAAASMGVFTWLGIRPIMAYLRALLLCDNMVAFLWTAQQFLDAYTQYGTGSARAAIGAPPILKAVNDAVEEALDGLCDEAADLIDDAERLIEAEEVSVRTIADSQLLLQDMHPFITKLIKLTLDCSNVVTSSDMPETPSLMKGIIEDVTVAATDCINAWSALLGMLTESRLSDRVSSLCGPLVEDLRDEVTHLRDVVAQDSTNEGLMDMIVGECDAFLEAVGNANDGGGGGKGGKKRRS